MKYKGQITSMKKSSIASTGEEFFDVLFTIFEDDKVVQESKFAFPLEATKEEIKAELKKAVKLFKEEKKQKEKQAIEDEKQANAEKVIEEMNGLEV